MLGLFMVSVVFTRRSAIDATAVVAPNCSVVHLEQKLYIGCSSCLDVVCGFADERGMNLLLRPKILVLASSAFLSPKLSSSNKFSAIKTLRGQPRETTASGSSASER